MNIKGQTGLDLAKQVQIEKFIQAYKIDILNCQEINIVDDSFEQCNHINSAFQILCNNAANKYGTYTLVRNEFEISNIKKDTKGRVLVFDINNVTFGNVYLPSGTKATIRNSREEYCGTILPQLLLNKKESGCIGGDWNCIVSNVDATKNQSIKQSPCLKRLIKTFEWVDSFRQVCPSQKVFSRVYETQGGEEGGTCLDRSYHYGSIAVLQARYVGVAFSDHFALIITIGIPEDFAKLICPRSKPLYKAKPEVITDPTFQIKLREKFSQWKQIKDFGLEPLAWWEIIVKPGVKNF